MNQKTLTLTLIGFVAVMATAATFLLAAGPKDKEEGKFHLVYVVTAPDLDKKAWIEQVKKESYGPVTLASLQVGTEVDIEPGFLTDGTRIVFAFDYCRRHYPKINRDVRRQHEEQVAMAQVAPVDRADLAQYCQMKGFSLKGEQFTAMDNAGVHLTLSDAAFEPGTTPEFQGAGPYGGLTSPERFTAKIASIDGTPAEKLPAAQQAQQPYVFLMSRNRSLLERVVLVAKPTKEEASVLLARLERYKEKRRVEDPKGAKEKCDVYVPEGLSRVHGEQIWSAAKTFNDPIPIAERIYVDIDGDGQVDLLARLVEHSTQTMVRIYYRNGAERCAIRTQYNGNLYTLFRPITVLKTHNCVYAYTNEYELTTNSWQSITPLLGPTKGCRHHDVWRWYEKH